jgi:hypothetical protein
MNKRISVLISIALTSSLYAKNQVEDTYVIGEKSWSFYNEIDKKIDKEFDKKTDKLSKNKRPLHEILEDLVRLSKKQLVEQKRIREILEEEFNPKPQIITKKDGSKCVANSSADCFVMPLTSTAKRVPVFKNWLQNPTIENSVKKKQWLSKYVNQITKGAYSDMFALQQYPNAYNTSSYNSLTYSNGMGKGSVVQSKFKKSILDKYKDKYKLYIFIGSSEMDLYSVDVLAKTVSLNSQLNYEIVYKDSKAKKMIEEYAQRVGIVGVFNHHKNYIGGKYFKKFNIQATPALSIGINGELQTLATGRISNSTLIDKVNQYLEFKGVVKASDYKDFKMWNGQGSIATDYIKNMYGVDISTNQKDK